MPNDFLHILGSKFFSHGTRRFDAIQHNSIRYDILAHIPSYV